MDLMRHMKNKQIYFFVGIVIIALIFSTMAIIKVSPRDVRNAKPQVVTSFYPLYFFTKEIAGAYVDVYNITPAGAEPHDYEPTPNDVVKLETSNLVVVNGNLEPWIDKISEELSIKRIPVIRVGANLVSQDFINEKGAQVKDPHIWLSPPLAKKIVQIIANNLITIDQVNKTYYRVNASELERALDKLDTQFKEGLAHCQQKDFVTSHAAFGYLATQYGIRQIGIAGLSPDAEPSAKELADVTSFVKKNNIKYIFFETLASPKLSQTIAAETGAQTLVLNPLEGLTPREIAQGKNYFTEMTQNLANLRIALQCQ